MPSPAQAPDFSDAAVQQLSEVLQLYVSSWDDTRHTTLRVALERLCAEARAANLGPERLLVVVKAAWARVPGIERVDRERSHVALERAVGHCIALYYGES